MQIRVGSYNIRNGLDVKHDFAVIAKDIVDMQLDICGLQEVDNNTSRNNMQDTMALLSYHTGYKYYRYTKTIDFCGGEYGTAIISKHPITDFETFGLSCAGYENRMLAHAAIDIGGKGIDFFNTHLSFENSDIQLMQFGEVASHFNACERAVLTGDFNTDKFDRFGVFEGTALNNRQNILLSFEHRAAIDNIVVSRSGVIKSGGMPSEMPDHSDHRMIYADIEF